MPDLRLSSGGAAGQSAHMGDEEENFHRSARTGYLL